MEKIFHNTLGYEYEGWYICEYHNYPYKNRTNKSIFTKGDPEVDRYLEEREQVQKKLEDELVEIAKSIGIQPDNNLIVVENEDGKRLTEELLRLGWKKEFIPFGP